MLYRLSYYYYTMIGAMVVVLVGFVVSVLTGPNDPKTMNKDLLSPAIHGFLPKADKQQPREEHIKMAPRH